MYNVRIHVQYTRHHYMGIKTKQTDSLRSLTQQRYTLIQCRANVSIGQHVVFARNPT